MMANSNRGFPTIRQPDLRLLNEGADTNDLADELHDLLGKLGEGFDYMDDVLERREQDLGLDQPESESEATQTETETEEEDNTKVFS